MFEHSYIPIPEKSGYDEAIKEFSVFAVSMRTDYDTVMNSIFQDVGLECGSSCNNNNNVTHSSDLGSALTNPVTVLFKLRTEIVETLELLTQI